MILRVVMVSRGEVGAVAGSHRAPEKLRGRVIGLYKIQVTLDCAPLLSMLSSSMLPRIASSMSGTV
jgi:hypothetical protein